MASVTPRKNANGSVTWRVQARSSGRMMQESFSTKRAADQFAGLVDRVGFDAARAVRAARDAKHVGVPTLSEWAKTYLDPANGYLAGVTMATAEGYRLSAERSFLKFLGEIPVDSIGEQDVARWIHWQEQQVSARTGAPMSAKTVRNYHSVLSAMLASAAKAGHIAVNPARGAKITRGQQVEMVLISPAEFGRILAELPVWAQPLALFLAGTGMRWGEATALTWGDINFDVDPATARVTKAWKHGMGMSRVIGPPKTKKSVRTVSLPANVTASLIEMHNHAGAGDLLFPSPAGNSQRTLEKRFHAAWHEAVERSGIGKQPRVHDLRHAHASWLIAQGTPLPMIQARLGHEKVTTTVDVYGHLSPEAHTQMAFTMNDVMTAPAKALTTP